MVVPFLYILINVGVVSVWSWVLLESPPHITCECWINQRIPNIQWQYQTIMWKIQMAIHPRKLLNNSLAENINCVQEFASNAELHCVWKGSISINTILNKSLSYCISILTINEISTQKLFPLYPWVKFFRHINNMTFRHIIFTKIYLCSILAFSNPKQWPQLFFKKIIEGANELLHFIIGNKIYQFL